MLSSKPAAPQRVRVGTWSRASVASAVPEVLVPEPREGCVLYCLLDAFKGPGYPLKFVKKHETDRKLSSFASYRATALWPHDLALIMCPGRTARRFGRLL